MRENNYDVKFEEITPQKDDAQNLRYQSAQKQPDSQREDTSRHQLIRNQSNFSGTKSTHSYATIMSNAKPRYLNPSSQSQSSNRMNPALREILKKVQISKQ